MRTSPGFEDPRGEPKVRELAFSTPSQGSGMKWKGDRAMSPDRAMTFWFDEHLPGPPGACHFWDQGDSGSREGKVHADRRMREYEESRLIWFFPAMSFGGMSFGVVSRGWGVGRDWGFPGSQENLFQAFFKKQTRRPLVPRGWRIWRQKVEMDRKEDYILKSRRIENVQVGLGLGLGGRPEPGARETKSSPTARLWPLVPRSRRIPSWEARPVGAGSVITRSGASLLAHNPAPAPQPQPPGPIVHF